MAKETRVKNKKDIIFIGQNQIWMSLSDKRPNIYKSTS